MATMTTEERNPRSSDIDRLSASKIARLMNSEDALIAEAVAREEPAIARAIEAIAASFQAGGRLLYIGAGTSGRLGVLDASECPPTFNSDPRMVVGIIAGGPAALTNAIEGAEDDPQQSVHDLQQHNLSSRDTLVGIATSGRTPYVLGALNYARQVGATAIGLTCNANTAMHSSSDIIIAPIVGPEVVSGSTRLKAGTATKMVLNMLTTGAMILIGKTYGNLMVDLRASNTKLKERSVRIVAQVTQLSTPVAEQLLTRCDGEVKTAILVHLASVDATNARRLLAEHQGRLRDAIAGATPQRSNDDTT